jgi:general secretion pathway protein K
LRAQRGMAVLMALLLVALSTSAVALVLWQQGLWWHQVEHDHRRAQMRLWLDAELSWAMSRLKPRAFVAPSQPWAQPFTYQEAQAHLSARLQDMQGRLNLNALAKGRGLIDQQQLAYYRNLLQQLQLSPTLADSLIRWRGLRAEDASARPPASLFRPPMLYWPDLQRVSGYTPQVLARLEPYVVLLPDEVRSINLNSVSPLLLQVMLPQVSPGLIQHALAQRTQHGFRQRADFAVLVNLQDGQIASSLNVGSSWFLLQGTVRQGEMQRQIQALLRVDAGRVVLVWRHDQALPGRAANGGASEESVWTR